jgi:hypothetical protein
MTCRCGRLKAEHTYVPGIRSELLVTFEVVDKPFPSYQDDIVYQATYDP